MKKSMIPMVFAVIGGLTAPTALADPTGPTFPPPGGVIWTPSGAFPGEAGGENWGYSNFNFAAGNIASLWWGPTANAMGISLDDGQSYTGSEILSFASFSGNSATWTGSSSLTWLHDHGSSAVWHNNELMSVRYTVTLSGNATWVNPGPLAITGDNGVVANVTGDFTANLLAEGLMPVARGGFGGGTVAGGPNAWQPIDDAFNSYSTGGATGSTFGAGFWVQPIPAPGAALLGVLGLGMVGLVRRRRAG